MSCETLQYALRCGLLVCVEERQFIKSKYMFSSVHFEWLVFSLHHQSLFPLSLLFLLFNFCLNTWNSFPLYYCIWLYEWYTSKKWCLFHFNLFFLNFQSLLFSYIFQFIKLTHPYDRAHKIIHLVTITCMQTFEN